MLKRSRLGGLIIAAGLLVSFSFVGVLYADADLTDKSRGNARIVLRPLTR